MPSAVTDDQAARYLDDPRFSQSFELPAGSLPHRQTPFKVTYADFGYRNEATRSEGQHEDENGDGEERVLLLFPGMMASRWLQTTKDKLAKQHKIRVVAPDRPGFGGTDAVSVDQRLDVWRSKCLLTRPQENKSEAVPTRAPCS
jgi:pimeloyl-ACP methyl ester carboxylesterase